MRRLPGNVHRITAGRYEVSMAGDQITHVIVKRHEHVWEIWTPVPPLGVYEAKTLTECFDWLGLTWQ